MMTRSGTPPTRAAIYARVSTLEQTAENQLAELRRYADVRGWIAREYVDEGVSGAKEHRPALDALLRDARRTPIRRPRLLAVGPPRTKSSQTTLPYSGIGFRASFWLVLARCLPGWQ